MKKLVMIILISVLVMSLMSVPAPKRLIEYIQPDGSTLTIKQMGDEWIHWSETSDGYTLLDNDGWKVYSILNSKGDMIPSKVRASAIESRSSEETTFIQTISKHLRFSSQQCVVKREANRTTRLGNFPTSGNVDILVIPAQFTDYNMSYTTNSFENMMNNPGNFTGCFKSYYEENSYGTFSPTATVSPIVTVNNTHDYYGPQDQWRTFATHAVQAANAYVNFADFDNDNDNTVEGVIIIHAGQGQETSGSANDIWSHMSNFSIPVNVDGVTVSHYAIVGESGSWGLQAGVGVSAHEFGHLLGLPDYYNTTSGEDPDCVGEWDLMSSGAWNNNSWEPAHHNAWSKYFLGWMDREILEVPDNYSITHSNSNNTAYAIETPGYNEWFYLENRQQIGYNGSVPGHGLLIVHVDEGYILQHLSSNDVNNSNHKGLQIESANGELNSYSAPFPHGTNDAFTDETDPASLTWNNQPTDRPVESITESGQVITFDYWNGPGYNPLMIPTTLNGYLTDENNVYLEWSMPNILGSDYFELSYSNLELDEHFNLGIDTSFEVGCKYESSDLADYEGLYLHRVRFYANDTTCSYTLNVYNESDGSLSLSQAIPEINPIGFTDVLIETPFTPNADNDIIVAIEASSGANATFGSDNVTYDEGISDLIRVNDNWQSAHDDYDWNGDWLIEIVLTDAGYTRSYIPDSYNLYKNGSLLANIDDWEQTSYLEIGPEEGLEEYYVTSVYAEGESEQSNTETVNIDFNLSPTPWTDDFEVYTDFTQDLYPWHSADLDQTQNYPMNVTFPGNGASTSFILFNPSATVPPLSGNWTPHSGAKEMVAFSANSSNGSTNDDWLISPNYDVIENSAFSFFAKTIDDSYGNDRIRVMISTGSTNPEDFVQLSSGDYLEPPEQWTEYAFSLTDFIGQRVRVAINCITEDAIALAIDDCTFDQRVVSNDENQQAIKNTKLIGCYPNPFNPTTGISFYLDKQQNVSLEVFNVRGQHVRTLVNDVKPQGNHSVSWDGLDSSNQATASGVYFYKLKAGSYTKSKKMVLLK